MFSESVYTGDFRHICEFLGLEYEEWEKGFDTLEALFERTIARPCFLVAPYRDDLLGSLQRRAKDRPTLQKFASWLEQKRWLTAPVF